MAEETKTEEEPVGILNDPAIADAANDLLKSMDTVMGKLRLAQFPDGSLHPDSVVQTFVSLKGGLIQTQHQNLLCLAALETLSELLPEERKADFVAGVVAKLGRSRQSIEDAGTVAAKKPILAEAPRPSGIITPGS